MNFNFTQNLKFGYLKKLLPLYLIFSSFSAVIFSQSLVNGNLNTGPISSNGVAAPAGYNWSELQNGNENAGYSVSIESQYSLSDDFIIPEGETWNLTNINLYAYVTGYILPTSPFNEVRLQIFSSDPSTGNPVPVFGDMTSNRFLSSVSSGMYRIFFGDIIPPNQRKIWEITASAATTLTAGHYWIEWQIGTIAAGSNTYAPSSTVVGTVTQPGNNALHHILSTNTWQPLLDLTHPQDMPFKVNYTLNCTNPTLPVVSASPSLICVGESTTLTVNSGNLNNAGNWVWYTNSCGGTIAGTGRSITVSPSSTTTYYVRGEGGCVTNGECAEVIVTVNPCQCLTPDVASICEGGIQTLSITQAPGVSQPYSSTHLITIPSSTAPSSPYPSVINISGLPTSGLVIKSVTINGVNHDWGEDVDILLQSPSGQNVVLMSDAGSFFEIFNADLTFSDAATQYLPQDDEIMSGNYLPTNYETTDNFPAPGPGSITQSSPLLSTLSGDVNGDWKLFVVDDFIGFGGSIEGWSITFETQTTASWSPAESLFTNPAGTIPYVAGTQVATVYASPSITTTYTANILGGPCNGNNVVTVNVIPRPSITVSPADGGCAPLSLTASGGLSYNWSPSEGLNNITEETVLANPNISTLYTVTGTSENGCSGTASVQVNSASNSAILSGNAPAITQLSEGFENGIPADWTTINNSDVVGTNANWSDGNPIVFPAHSGSTNSYAFANYQLSGGNIINAWMLTKPVTISNGDKFSFWTRTTDGTFPDRLELRMSTRGNSENVGTSATSVGDFSNLLLTINPNLLPGTTYPNSWTKFEVIISGLPESVTGRFGFRYWIDNIDINADYIGIDDILFQSPQSCSPANSGQEMTVNINGGEGPFSVVFNDGSNDYTINNYVSGSPISIFPSQSTTYSLVSVTGANGCEGTNLSGTNFVNIEPVIISSPRDTSACIGGNATFSINSIGTDLNYLWQYSEDNGLTWSDINSSDYSGINTSTLNIINVTENKDSLLFRAIIGNTSCGDQTSQPARFTTSSSPEITINPGAYSALYPGLTTTLTANVNPPGVSSYQWYLNGNAVYGAINQNYTVNIDGTGIYTVGVTNANGCFSLSDARVEIRDSANSQLFIYPNPNAGQFTVRYWAGNSSSSIPESVTVFDEKGSRIFTQHFSITIPFQEMKIDMTKYSKGIYWIEITDKKGKRIKTGKVIIK